jgi:hypothetical protein
MLQNPLHEHARIEQRGHGRVARLHIRLATHTPANDVRNPRNEGSSLLPIRECAQVSPFS